MHFLKIPSLNFNVFLFFASHSFNSYLDFWQSINHLTDNTYYKSCIHVHKRQKRIWLHGIYVPYGGSVNSSELWRHVVQ
jgi:hypothetical protein